MKQLLKTNLLQPTLADFLNDGGKKDILICNIFGLKCLVFAKVATVDKIGIFYKVLTDRFSEPVCTEIFNLNDIGYQRLVHYVTKHILTLSADCEESCKESLKYFEETFVEAEGVEE